MNPTSQSNRNNNLGVISLDEEISQSSVVHKNVGQEYIVTTKDKVELALNDQQYYLKTRRDWITPATLFISVLATLVAADFKNFGGLSSDFWKAIYVLLLCSSFIWLIYTSIIAIKHINKGGTNYFIQTLTKKDNIID